MNEVKSARITFRLTAENKSYLDRCFEVSGTRSKDEFIRMLLDCYNSQIETAGIIPVEKIEDLKPSEEAETSTSEEITSKKFAFLAIINRAKANTVIIADSVEDAHLKFTEQYPSGKIIECNLVE